MLRVKFTLVAFGALLLLSSAVSFVGYRYLALASEFRERNFVHLETTQDIQAFLRDRSYLVPQNVPVLQSKFETAEAQAQWCIDTLSGFEAVLFSVMGTYRALPLCESNIEFIRYADEVLLYFQLFGNAMLDYPNAPINEVDLLNGVAKQMLSQSRAFQPFVSVIESRLQRFVWLITIGIGLCIAVIFVLIARQMLIGLSVQRQQTEALREQTYELRQLAAIAERANDSIQVTDKNGYITWVNPAFEELSGYSYDEVKGKRPGDILQGADTNPETKSEIRRALDLGQAIKCDILNYTKQGRRYWINLSISPLQDQAEGLRGFVAISHDVTSEREQRDRLAEANREIGRQARHDPLTGLPNRRYIDEVLQNEVTNADPPRTLIRIDLDHFKNVNDTIGHAAGDSVLQTVSDRLRTSVGPDDLVGRVGGDEFVIVLALGTTEDAALELAERLCTESCKDIEFERSTLRVGASLGVASATDGLIGNEDLLKAADAALYLAKRSGRNTTRLYSPAFHATVNEQRRLSKDLERAIEDQEIEAFFQPQIDAETNELVGVEALARWRHPERGVLLPGEFLPVAEKLNIVSEIDLRVMRDALNGIQQLHASGISIPKIAFNSGIDHLQSAAFLEIASDFDIGDTRVSIEVLESVLVEEQGEEFSVRLSQLRSEGFGIELDDFGSGHASVIALQWLNPEFMKIDRRLIAPVHQDHTARSLVQSIIDMGDALGIGVIAEGVETASHASILRDLGCDVLQGYYFARPMPFNELAPHIASKRLQQLANGVSSQSKGLGPTRSKNMGIGKPRLLSAAK